MLVLNRRVGETILIGDNVTFTVLGVTGTQVRLGITAPPFISVDRAEIRLRKEREAAIQQRAAVVDG